jgi:hypothetical protein
MKKFTAFFLAIAFVSSAFGQGDTIVSPSAEVEEMEFETPDRTQVKIGEKEVFIIEENGDTTTLQLGQKGMSIVEEEDGYTIDIIEMDEEDDKEKNEKKHSKSKKFKPNYAGLEIGMNNFMNSDYSLHTGSFMDLNTAKSWNFNLNFLEYGIGLGTSYVGLVTGMGFEWSNYVFDSNNSVEKDANDFIVERDLSTLYTGITKSKLATTYLTAPLLLEFQIPAGKKRIHISGGVIGGIKIGSKTKVKYNDGNKNKSNIKGDYNLSPFRYGATVRVGYRAINLFANYYFSPLFVENTGPELYPFSIGLSIIEF